MWQRLETSQYECDEVQWLRNILFDDNLPSLSRIFSFGVAARSLLAAGLVTYRAAVEACSDNLFCLSCAEGSGQCKSSTPEALSTAIVGMGSRSGEC
jgi:hypothetical protein